MATIEIDEVELLRLKRQDQTVHSLMSNPKAKRRILEAYKDQYPDAKIPELEIEEAARKPVEDLTKTVIDLKKQIDDDKAEREKFAKLASLSDGINAQKAKFRRAGWCAEDIAAVEKLMEEKGTTDFELAAALYEKNRPPSQVATPSGVGGWNFVDNVQDAEKDLKALVDSRGNNEALADKMAREALQEVRGAQRR